MSGWLVNCLELWFVLYQTILFFDDGSQTLNKEQKTHNLTFPARQQMKRHPPTFLWVGTEKSNKTLAPGERKKQRILLMMKPISEDESETKEDEDEKTTIVDDDDSGGDPSDNDDAS
jgi:hypothetical protein